MMPFDGIEAYDIFFTKERYALRALEGVGLRNLHYLPMYCVPAMHHPVELTPEEQLRYARPLSFVGSRYAYCHQEPTTWGVAELGMMLIDAAALRVNPNAPLRRLALEFAVVRLVLI